MNRTLALLFVLCAGTALAQELDRSTALNQAYENARAAQQALDAAEAKRSLAEEPQPGERSGNAGGGSRLNDNYFARQQTLDGEVDAARKRYEEAMKRWNDLK